MQLSDEVLERHFGLPSFRPWQREAIAALQERDRRVLVLAPTGGGKSLCYQYPAAVLEGTSIVISPLIALMDDQVRSLQERGIEATYLASTLDREELRQREAGMLRGDYKLVYLAPERLRNDWLIRQLGQLRPPLIAIDEAHCISHWGHDFRPDYLRIGDLLRRLRPERVLACTATATPAVRDEIMQRLDMNPASTAVVLRGFARPNLHLSALELDGAKPRQRAAIRKLTEVLGNAKDPSGAAIVYAGTRRASDKLAEVLRDEGWRCEAYHAGIGAEEREKVSGLFASKSVDVVVATNAFGMGIDRSDIRVVVHLRAPGSIEQYYQEVGRAGRDGQPAHGMLISGSSDIGLRRRLIEMNGNDQRDETYFLQQWNLFLDLMRYAEAGSCRHDFILRYFGDEQETLGGCGHCDVCERLENGEDEQDEAAVTLLVRKALSGVARLRQRASLTALADSLHGSQSQRMLQLGLHQLTTHGLMSEHKKPWILALLRRLITAGLVDVTAGDFPVPFLTPRGREVMLGRRDVRLVLPSPDAGREKGGRKAKRRKGAAKQEPIDPKNMPLFEALRAARLNMAKERGVPAYVVCHDRTLVDMANQQPQSLEAMHGVFGMGPARVESYGPQFLVVLDQHASA